MNYLKLTLTVEGMKKDFEAVRFEITNLEKYTDSSQTRQVLTDAWNKVYDAQIEIEKERT